MACAIKCIILSADRLSLFKGLLELQSEGFKQFQEQISHVSGKISLLIIYVRHGFFIIIDIILRGR